MKNLIHIMALASILAVAGCLKDNAAQALDIIKPGMTRAELNENYRWLLGTRHSGLYVHKKLKDLEFDVKFQTTPPTDHSTDTVTSAVEHRDPE